jgi:hypothetical protein
MVYLVTDKDGRVVLTGDTVTDFRGDTATFIEVLNGPSLGKSAKVLVERDSSGIPYRNTNYANVFDLTVEPLTD